VNDGFVEQIQEARQQSQERARLPSAWRTLVAATAMIADAMCADERVGGAVTIRSTCACYVAKHSKSHSHEHKAGHHSSDRAKVV
jgi:hypothetical protein